MQSYVKSNLMITSIGQLQVKLEMGLMFQNTINLILIKCNKNNEKFTIKIK